MTSGANGEWVRQGTPHDDSADWNEEQSEYGTAISPTEWDDYSSEQSVPVAPPRPQETSGIVTAKTPASPTEQDLQAVPEQEPDAGEDVRADAVDPWVDGEPEGDAHDSGLDPAPIEEPVDEPVDEPGLPDDTAAPTESVTADPAAVAPPADESAPQDVVEDPVSEDEAGRVETGTQDTDDELTQHVDVDDMEATQAVPVAAAAVAADPRPAAIPPGLYRADGSEETAVIAPDAYPNQDAEVEEERLQAQLEAERQAREQRLGAVPTSTDNASREDAGPPRVSTDRFFPSLGLFVLRLVTAGILGVASYQILGSGVDATADYLAGHPLIPEPRLVSWILGFTLAALALLLVIGMVQRVVGFVLLTVAVLSLVFIRWGNFSIFAAEVEGFIGDRDLLLAAVGLVLLTIGGGAWGIDGAFRRAREASKAERQS